MRAEDRCSRGVASPSPRRLRTSPSKPTYVPVTEVERRAARDTSAVSKWDLLRGTPLPAVARRLGERARLGGHSITGQVAGQGRDPLARYSPRTAAVPARDGNLMPRVRPWQK